MYLRSILALFLFYSSFAIGQESENLTSVVTGIIKEDESRYPVPGVHVSIPKLGKADTTDEAGQFLLANIPPGTYLLCFRGSSITTDTIKIVAKRTIVDLGTIHVHRPHSINDRDFSGLPVISLADTDIADGIDGGQELGAVSGLLTAGRDPFSTASAFSWSSFRYRVRGYEQRNYEVSINGLPINDIASGGINWSLWGGLNDVFRNATTAYGLMPTEGAYGGIGGSSYLEATALSQRKQTRVTYSLSNRLYSHRIMITHSSGPLTNGWAYSASLSKRWAEQGYIPGTYYDGYSYFAAVTKKVGNSNQVDFTMFGSPAERGRASSSYLEAYELSESNYYNPTWGLQNGVVRNSRVQKSFQPVFILSHKYSPSPKTIWNSSIGHIRGRSSNTLLDWSKAADPRPDYYQNLPGYYLHRDNPDSTLAEEHAEAFKLKPQIDWDGLYNANYLNRTVVPGGTALSDDSARLSLFVLSADVVETKKWVFSTNLQHVVNNNISLAAGFSYVAESGRFFRELVDLLGGDFYLNVNSFAERVGSNGISNSNWYYNLNDSDAIVRKGDKYFYDYGLKLQRSNAWGQVQMQYKKWDLFAGGKIGRLTLQRDGYYRNGIFSSGNESYGHSKRHDFTTYGAKAGLTFKLNGRNYMFISGGISKEAPTVDQTFVSVRLRNKAVEGATLQSVITAEGGYFLRSPGLNVRFVGYVTEISNTVQIQRFFYQGTGSANTFVNYVMQGLGKRHLGLEIGGDYKLTSAFTASLAAHIGQHFFTNNPRIYIYNENSSDTIVRRDNVYISNYYLGGQPQSTYTAAFRYQSKKYWYASLSANYVDRNYTVIAAPRRSETVAEVVEYSSDEWNTLLRQERLPSAFTLDLFCGKSFLLSGIHRHLLRNAFLYLNVGVNNILNNKSIAVAAFENPRFDYAAGYIGKFAPKYSYAQGRNYFVNLALKF